MITLLVSLNLVTTYGLTGFVQQAAAEALENDYGVEQIADTYNGRRKVFLDAVRGLNDITVHGSEGGMYVMLDVSAVEPDDEKFAWAFLDAENVSVMPGSSFGDAAAGHIRISLCQPDEVLLEAAKPPAPLRLLLSQQGGLTYGRPPLQGPRRHHRRRRFRLLGRLSSDEARLDGCGAARAQAADLGHHLARGRADRPVARLAEHDAAREIFGRPLRQAGGRDRRRDRHAAGRLDHAWR